MKDKFKIFSIAIYVLALILAVAAAFFPTSFGLPVTFGLMILVILLILVFFVVTAIKNIRTVIKPLAGLLILLLVFFIGYSVSASYDYFNFKGELVATASTVKMVGGELFIGIVAIIGAAIVLVGSEVVSLFR